MQQCQADHVEIAGRLRTEIAHLRAKAAGATHTMGILKQEAKVARAVAEALARDRERSSLALEDARVAAQALQLRHTQQVTPMALHHLHTWTFMATDQLLSYWPCLCSHWHNWRSETWPLRNTHTHPTAFTSFGFASPYSYWSR